MLWLDHFVNKKVMFLLKVRMELYIQLLHTPKTIQFRVLVHVLFYVDFWLVVIRPLLGRMFWGYWFLRWVCCCWMSTRNNSAISPLDDWALLCSIHLGWLCLVKKIICCGLTLRSANDRATNLRCGRSSAYRILCQSLDESFSIDFMFFRLVL